MIEPESDYETWQVILTSTLDDPQIFEQFIPQIDQLLDFYQSNQHFPKSISYSTALIFSFPSNSIFQPLILKHSLLDEFITLITRTTNKLIDIGFQFFKSQSEVGNSIFLSLIPNPTPALQSSDNQKSPDFIGSSFSNPTLFLT
jgi:hypothetical protein